MLDLFLQGSKQTENETFLILVKRADSNRQVNIYWFFTTWKEVTIMANLTVKLMNTNIASDPCAQKHENSLRSNIAGVDFWYAGTSGESRLM